MHKGSLKRGISVSYKSYFISISADSMQTSMGLLRQSIFVTQKASISKGYRMSQAISVHTMGISPLR